MNRDKIAEFRNAIKVEYELKLKKLKEEMEASLSSLSKIEESLSDTKKTQTNQSNLFSSAEEGVRKVRRHHERPPVIKIKRRITVPIRMKAALDKMKGDFTRKDFLEQLNNDEVGTAIPEGTFAPEFSKLLKTDVISTVKEPYGTQGGIYRKG